MVTPEKIRQNAAKLDALMEAFERTYLHFVDLHNENDTKEDIKARNRGVIAFYALREIADEIGSQAEELCEHAEVCNTILAINMARREKGDD